jgi:hypothetical protein
MTIFYAIINLKTTFFYLWLLLLLLPVVIPEAETLVEVEEFAVPVAAVVED